VTYSPPSIGGAPRSTGVLDVFVPPQLKTELEFSRQSVPSDFRRRTCSLKTLLMRIAFEMAVESIDDGHQPAD